MSWELTSDVSTHVVRSKSNFYELAFQLKVCDFYFYSFGGEGKKSKLDLQLQLIRSIFNRDFGIVTCHFLTLH